jgi:Flp pilus assembly protein TadD
VLRKRRVQLLLVTAAGLAAYANTLGVPFTFDDERCIVANPVLRSLDYFAHPDRAKAIGASLGCAFESRIVGNFTFALNYRAGGLEPAGYHAVNLAIHLGSAALVYLLVVLALRAPFFERRGAGEDAGAPLPFLAALLFVVHPLQTGAVTYVTQRFTSLATFLYLLAAVLYLAFRLRGGGAARAAAYAGALAAALLATFTKEISLTLPFALALFEVALFAGPATRRLAAVAPFFGTLLVFAARSGLLAPGATVASVDEGVLAAGQSPLTRGEYVVTQLRVVVTYLRLFVLPVGQNVDHDYPAYRSLASPAVLLSLALLLALLALALVLWVRSSRRDGTTAPELRLAGVGVLWFFGTLTVESAAVPLTDLIFEHRMYLPMVGLCIAAASAVVALRARLLAARPRAAAAVLPAFGGVVVLLAIATLARNHVWGDELRLWEDAARKSPSKVRPRMQLAALYSERGRSQEALREVRAAIALQPGYAEAYNSLGVVLRRGGQIEEAMDAYAAALRLRPGFAEARHNLALLLAAQGRLAEATRELEEAVRTKPEYAEAHNALGVLYAQQGRIADAVLEWQATLALNPAHGKARANLNRALGGM